jgi:histidinol phosphatase-like PHP family hydrolase
MIANYHAHTYRCGHAEGAEADYAREAEKAGLRRPPASVGLGSGE